MARTRTEHVQWCKDRALQYVDTGDLRGALLSMTSDLNKHPETADHPGSQVGLMELLFGGLDTPEKMRHHIEGYN